MDCIYKKVAGTLKLNPSGLMWTAATAKGIDPLSIPYDRMKAQQVNKVDQSKDGKVILKITVWADGAGPEISYNLQFTGSNALSQRDIVKERLAVAIARNQSRGVGGPSAAAGATGDGSAGGGDGGGGGGDGADESIRRALLAKDRELQQLYNELVVRNKVITADDFWEMRHQLLEDQKFESEQRTGRSSQYLADVRPEGSGDGANKLVFTMTPEIKHSIFIQFPSVKKAFEQEVPHNVSVAEFWRRYFSSKYFQQRTRATGASADVDDFFRPYMDEDEDDYLPEPKRRKLDPRNRLVDLSTTKEDHFSDYGNQPDITMKAGASKKEYLSIIRQFNRHSTVVLNAASNEEQDAGRSSVEEEILIDDLSAPVPEKQILISISDPSKFFEGQTDGSYSFSAADKPRLLSEFKQIVDAWTPDLPNITVDNTACDKILRNLSQRGEKRKHSESQTPFVDEKIRVAHSAACELLRHFWTIHARPDPDAEKLRVLKNSLQQSIKGLGDFEKDGRSAKLVENIKGCIAKALAL